MRIDTQDFRFAVRRLGKHPGGTAASIAALACGSAAVAVTWSLLSAVLLKPLAVLEPDRLFQVDLSLPSPLLSMGIGPTYTYEDFETIAESEAFERIAASGTSANIPLVTDAGDIPQRRTFCSSITSSSRRSV